MSLPDYAQSLEDHRKVLILLQPLEDLIPNADFETVADAITTYHALTPIPGHQDEEVPRSLQARFVRHHPVENNQWGDFQAHRQAMGLICVAGYHNQTELESACRAYTALKEKYALTVVDGLLVLLDMREPTVSPSTQELPLGEDTENGDETVEKIDFSLTHALLPFCSKDVLRCRLSNLGPLHSRTRDFMIVLFWLLESRRLNWIQSQGSSGGEQLLMAPFEQRQLVGLIRDGRQSQRRQAGRQRKHLGDLCLLCGLPTAALEAYQTAYDLLRAANDWLWVGACAEGLCAASAVVHYGTGDPIQAALRSTNQSPSQVRRRSSKDILGDESAISEATRQLLDEHYMLAPDQDGLGALPNCANSTALPKHCLSPDGIVTKYQEVMDQYKKYSLASVISLEAGLKCCRLMIRQQRRLDAAAFLGRILNVKLSPNEDTGVRYAVVARLYELMLFPRKAAFYRRMAGLQRVQADGSAAHADFHAFLFKAAPAYDLQLEPNERSLAKSQLGWPALKVEHLYELACAAVRTEHWAMVVNYCTYALDIGCSALNEERLTSFIDMLSNAQDKTGDSSVHRCFFIPKVDILKLSPLAPHLQPTMTESLRRHIAKPKAPSPFIYSPMLTPKKQHVRSKSTGDCSDLGSKNGCLSALCSHVDVNWVVGEVCRLELTLSNPLVRAVELSQLELELSVPGKPADSQVWSPCADPRVSLAPDCFRTVALLLEPPKTGRLCLHAWRYSMFGVLWEQELPSPHPILLVSPRLPILEVSTDLAPADDFVASEEGRERMVATGSLPLTRPDHADVLLTLAVPTSASCDVTSLVLDYSNDVRIRHLRSDYRKRCRLDGLLRWSNEDLQKLLPLRRGQSASLVIRVESSQLPDSATNLETLLTVQYSSEEAISDNWCRRHVVGIFSDVSWTASVDNPIDPFAEVTSPVLLNPPEITIQRATSVS